MSGFFVACLARNREYRFIVFEAKEFRSAIWVLNVDTGSGKIGTAGTTTGETTGLIIFNFIMEETFVSLDEDSEL